MFFELFKCWIRHDITGIAQLLISFLFFCSKIVSHATAFSVSAVHLTKFKPSDAIELEAQEDHIPHEIQSQIKKVSQISLLKFLLNI